MKNCNERFRKNWGYSVVVWCSAVPSSTERLIPLLFALNRHYNNDLESFVLVERTFIKSSQYKKLLDYTSVQRHAIPH